MTSAITPIRAGLVLMMFLCGCTAHQEQALRGIRRSGFISYWPPPENSRGPRVAVKDLIDVKGEVTTAGSKYLAKHSPPAERDAACLAQVRARGLPIVGKTNLTEF